MLAQQTAVAGTGVVNTGAREHATVCPTRVRAFW